MITLITLLPIPYQCTPLILHIACLWRQSHLLNLLHYLILYRHPHVIPLGILVLSTLPAVILLYTSMAAHTLVIWPMSPAGVHKPSPIPLDHLLMEEPVVGWPVLMSGCWNIPNNMQILWE